MALNVNVDRVSHSSDLSEPVSSALSAQNTFTSGIYVGGTFRRVTYYISGTWAGTVTLQKATDGASGTYSDVAGRTYTGNISFTVYNDGSSGDAWYRLGFKTGEYTSGTATCTLTRSYSQQKASADRISVVTDPLEQRGSVIKLFRNTGDAEVNSGKRVEIARDVFGSEYAFDAGGGWYHTSYMLGTEWATAAASGVFDFGPHIGNSKSAVIKQFHPKNADGFTHPIWTLRVSERGVSLDKCSVDDTTTYIPPKAVWPIDSLVWHDVVFGIKWLDDTDGTFYCFLDGKLVYSETGPQIYAGATAGCWFSEGIYLPGSERDVATLTMYTQGYRQGYPGTPYSDVVGSAPTRTITEADRSNSMRSTIGGMRRQLVDYETSPTDIVI